MIYKLFIDRTPKLSSGEVTHIGTFDMIADQTSLLNYLKNNYDNNIKTVIINKDNQGIDNIVYVFHALTLTETFLGYLEEEELNSW